MHILHIGLLSHYTEEMTYQDNILPICNCADGHKVTFISDTYTYKNGNLVEVPEEDRILSNSIRLIRISYDRVLTSFLTQKLQKVTRLEKLLEELKPDSILYHGLCGWGLTSVANYIRKNSHTLFYVDSHEDFNNTAQTLIAKLAYKYVHGSFIKKALPQISKILYISLETKEYIQDMYGIPSNLLEWYPLGGVIQTKEEQNLNRQSVISEFQLPNNSIILGHSGKLTKEKKTSELLRAFLKNEDKRLILLIWGNIPNETKEELEQLINCDSRIIYLGWKSEKDIYRLLCGCDLYCQPGSQSATMQTALCCGCPVMLFPHPSYQVYVNDNLFFVRNPVEIKEVIDKITNNPEILALMRNNSLAFAETRLDYKKLARRIYK